MTALSVGCDLLTVGCGAGIEGVFNEVQNTGQQLERLLRKTVEGLVAHVTAKITSHTLKHYLRRVFGIDVQTFSVVTEG